MSEFGLCRRCGRESPALHSPCPECSGYRISTQFGERPIVILDPKGFRVFSFATHQADLASEILHRLNSQGLEEAA